MKSFVRRRVHWWLLKNRLLLRDVTERDRLLEFIASARPVATNHALIRVGGDGDGGYLVPDDLEGIDACFSPGVSTIATFEEDLATRGIRCFLADHSVDGPPMPNALFDFEKKFLGPAESGAFTTLESWVRRKAPGAGDLLLQMDIEGAEYGVIFDTGADTLARFRILVIEFHDLDRMLDANGYELVRLTFTKLLKRFEVVHAHPNNCCGTAWFDGIEIPRVMEFTFLRKDRIATRAPRTGFPHALDRKNVASYPDLPLPACWSHPPG